MTVTQEKRIRAPGEMAQRYARAFYAYLADESKTSDVLQQVRIFYDALSQNEEACFILSDPRLDRQHASKIMSGLVAGLKLGDEMRRFVGVIAQQGRLSALEEILHAVLLLDAEKRGEVAVEICTAHALTDEQRDRLRSSLKEAGYEHIVMAERHDPSLLGGMTMRVGSVLFDTSIAGRLTRLQNAMKGAA